MNDDLYSKDYVTSFDEHVRILEEKLKYAIEDRDKAIKEIEEFRLPDYANNIQQALEYAEVPAYGEGAGKNTPIPDHERIYILFEDFLKVKEERNQAWRDLDIERERRIKAEDIIEKTKYLVGVYYPTPHARLSAEEGKFNVLLNEFNDYLNKIKSSLDNWTFI